MWKISSEVQGMVLYTCIMSQIFEKLFRLISKFIVSTTSHQHVRIAEARLELPPGGLDGVKIQHPPSQSQVIVRSFFQNLLQSYVLRAKLRQWHHCNQRISCSSLIPPMVQVRSCILLKWSRFLDLLFSAWIVASQHQISNATRRLVEIDWIYQWFRPSPRSRGYYWARSWSSTGSLTLYHGKPHHSHRHTDWRPWEWCWMGGTLWYHRRARCSGHSWSGCRDSGTSIKNQKGTNANCITNSRSLIPW